MNDRASAKGEHSSEPANPGFWRVADIQQGGPGPGTARAATTLPALLATFVRNRGED